jgi:hypothetical protein
MGYIGRVMLPILLCMATTFMPVSATAADSVTYEAHFARKVMDYVGRGFGGRTIASDTLKRYIVRGALGLGSFVEVAVTDEGKDGTPDSIKLKTCDFYDMRADVYDYCRLLAESEIAAWERIGDGPYPVYPDYARISEITGAPLYEILIAEGMAREAENGLIIDTGCDGIEDDIGFLISGNKVVFIGPPDQPVYRECLMGAEALIDQHMQAAMHQEAPDGQVSNPPAPTVPVGSSK